MFRLPQGFTVMAHPIIEHMKKAGVKTVGFLGYTDAYGELWLKEFTAQGEKAGIKVVAAERFARTDTSVTPQALKLVVGQPRRDAGRGLGLRRRHAAHGDHRARLQGQDLPDARRGHAGPGAHRRQGRRGHLRRLRPGGDRRATARQPPVEEGGGGLRAPSTKRPTARARATSSPATPTTRRSCSRRCCRWR